MSLKAAGKVPVLHPPASLSGMLLLLNFKRDRCHVVPTASSGAESRVLLLLLAKADAYSKSALLSRSLQQVSLNSRTVDASMHWSLIYSEREAEITRLFYRHFESVA